MRDSLRRISIESFSTTSVGMLAPSVTFPFSTWISTIAADSVTAAAALPPFWHPVSLRSDRRRFSCNTISETIVFTLRGRRKTRSLYSSGQTASRVRSARLAPDDSG
jgi:hypothetical protein